MSLLVFLTGLAMGFSLIVAIGAQNAFVLRQGLLGRFVWPVTLVCALSDAVLILVGVLCFGQVAQALPAFEPVMRYGGAAFLTAYAAHSLYSAFTSQGMLAASENVVSSLPRTITLSLALTWLNPHVYLDTLVLLGSLSAEFHGQQMSFAVGAITASFAFFIALGQGAAWLRPLLARPQVWRVVEALIALTMAATALRLVLRQ
jgi:L-lysine exporter family protein LysE/ArgO